MKPPADWESRIAANAARSVAQLDFIRDVRMRFAGGVRNGVYRCGGCPAKGPEDEVTTLVHTDDCWQMRAAKLLRAANNYPR